MGLCQFARCKRDSEILHGCTLVVRLRFANINYCLKITTITNPFTACIAYTYEIINKRKI